MRTRRSTAATKPVGWLSPAVAAAIAVSVMAVTACGTSSPTHRAGADGAGAGSAATSSPTPPATTTSRSVVAAARTKTAATKPATAKPSATRRPTKSPTKPPATLATKPRTTVGRGSAATALPLGGTRIFPRFRIVADYGAAGNAGLGVLGAGTPEQAASAIEKRAAEYRTFGKPVQPAMELLATVAQGSAGADGDFSKAVSPDAVAAYLTVAKRHHMLLVLDFQPGRGEFLPQVKQFRRFLDDPWVGVGLDPEWKIGPGQVPGTVIGSSSAASINAVSSYLAGIVRAEHLPQKLFVVHQFTLSMLPDRAHLTVHPELATVLHADGHGNRAVKTGVYHQLDFPVPFATGFKLFVTQDGHMMTPAQVMALRRRPDLITYE